jgi:anaerobic dimethyl sulfoxide reductase subunit B (iron-sulfur subunit)
MSNIKQLGFYLDSSVCIGCKTCIIACKDKNDLPVEVNWRKVIEYCGGSWNSENGDLVPSGVFVYYLTVSCQHCASPPCMKVCPSSAISKSDEGIVHVDQEKCIRDQSCLYACPYDAPQFGSDTARMSKCDMCADLRAIDKNPACVDACPVRALDWGDMSELRKKYGNTTAIDPLPDGSITNPSMILTPHRHAQLLSHGAGHTTDLPESNPAGINVVGPNIIKESKYF